MASQKQLPQVRNNGQQAATDNDELWRAAHAIWAILCRIGQRQITRQIVFRRWHVPVALAIFFLIFQFRQQPAPTVVQYVIGKEVLDSPPTDLHIPLPTEELPIKEPVVGEKTALVANKEVEASVGSTDAAKAYIKRFARVAQIEQQKYGVPASISLAQGLLESRSGSSKLATEFNNHFGIKCFSKKCKVGHCGNFADDSHKDFFRRYGNAWESWRSHSQMLSNGKYKRLHKYGSNYRKWAIGLRDLGYATDRQYANKLIGIIEREKLYEYDAK